MSFTPGVHSLPENVLSDQQTNMPHLRPFSSSTRLAMLAGSAPGDTRLLAPTITSTSTVKNRRMMLSPK